MTTLAGMVNHCNDNRPDHIITIEDPIEFVHESKRCLVNQREVHRDTLGFTEALRSALREDPPAAFVCAHNHLAVVDARIKNPILGPYDLLETLPDWEVAQ